MVMLWPTTITTTKATRINGTAKVISTNRIRDLVNVAPEVAGDQTDYRSPDCARGQDDDGHRHRDASAVYDPAVDVPALYVGTKNKSRIIRIGLIEIVVPEGGIIPKEEVPPLGSLFAMSGAKTAHDMSTPMITIGMTGQLRNWAHPRANGERPSVRSGVSDMPS